MLSPCSTGTRNDAEHQYGVELVGKEIKPSNYAKGKAIINTYSVHSSGRNALTKFSGHELCLSAEIFGPANSQTTK
jgi:hypothetical protein